MNTDARYDFDALDLMSEQQPKLLLDQCADLLLYGNESSALRIKCYYAKALISLSRLPEAEALVNTILPEAVLKDDSFALVWGNIILSKAYSNPDNCYKVKSCLELAEDFALKSGSLDLIIEAQSHTCLFLSGQGSIKTAMDYSKRVETLVKKTNPGLPPINALLRCAKLYHKLNDHPKVISLLKRALDIALEVGIISLQFSIIANLASTYNQLKRYHDSEVLLCKGYEVAKQHSQPSFQLKMLFNLGVLNNLQFKYDKAIEYYDQCQALAVEIGSNKPVFWVDLYCNFAACYWLSGNPQSSLEYLEKAEQLLANADLPHKKMWIAVNKTNILIAQSKYPEAKAILQSAIRFFNKAKDIPNLLIAYRNLALLYQKCNQPALSIKIYQTIDQIHIKHTQQILTSKTEGYQVHYPDLRSHTSADSPASFRPSPSAERLLFIGASEAVKKVIRTALLASQHHAANVFITGESGTGKEVIARYIHQNSVRKNNPFVAVNCSAISHSLIESEMFGHLKGSFTGALETTKGFFIAADRGTLFLDEITEMDIEMQPKLLRAMENKTVTPVGGNREIAFECRIISATNRNILDLLGSDALRLDIFHRLNTIQIHIPPLRERAEDLPLLLDYFIDQYCRTNKQAAPLVTKAFVDKLAAYHFPGNVRELKNIVNRMFILHPNQEWEPALLENTDIINHVTPKRTNRLTISQEEENHIIIKALLQSNGCQKEASCLLGMTESTLSRRIHKYHLQGYTKKA